MPGSQDSDCAAGDSTWHLITYLLITDKSHDIGSVKSHEEVVVCGAVLSIKNELERRHIQGNSVLVWGSETVSVWQGGPCFFVKIVMSHKPVDLCRCG